MNPRRPLVMRIITRLAGGGPPIHATILNRSLGTHGFDSLLVFGDCSLQEKNMEYLLATQDPIVRIPALGANFNPIHDLVALFQLWKLMLKHRPAVVHTHTAKAGFLGRLAALLAGVPCIVHTYHGHVLEGYFGAAVNLMLRWIETALGRFSTALCSVSKQQVDELSQKFKVAPEEKFHVVPLGLDLEPLLALEPPDFSAQRLTIGWLGRFVPIKNLRLLVEIAEAASRAKLPVNFLVAGDGVERSWFEIEIRIRQLLNVTLLPWQDNICEVLKQCHLLLLTSHREGTPLALIQGMAAARPFLATPAGGTVDLVSGVPLQGVGSSWYDNATLVEPAAETFVAAISQMLADRERLAAMSQSARTFACQSFNEHRLATDVAALYRHLLKDQKIASKATREVFR